MKVRVNGEIDEPYEHFDMAGCDIDFSQPPHCWVVKSVGNLVVKEAEEMLKP